jgi:hypothetical protein
MPRCKKQDTFILDFYNTATEIKAAFDEAELYSEQDIEKFNELFFNGEDAQKLHPIIDEAVVRFNLIENEPDKIDFKIKARQFVKLYGQLSKCMIERYLQQIEAGGDVLDIAVVQSEIDDPFHRTADGVPLGTIRPSLTVPP